MRRQLALGHFRTDHADIDIFCLLFCLLFLSLFFLFVCFRYAPIGVCSLIAQRVASMVDIGGELRRLALFIVTVLAGLSIHAFIILPLIFFAVRKANPFTFMYGMKDAFVTAFGISSRYENSYYFIHTEIFASNFAV